MKFAAIDIGTNAARLLIGEVISEKGSSYIQKYSYTRVPLRLGLEVFDKGYISNKKVKEFSKTMTAFRLLAELYQVKAMRVCATSAMRESANATEVIHFIKENAGVEIEVISGKTEADLIFGSFLKMDIDLSIPFVVVDVGGGSTEISVFENGNKTAAKSFQIGTIRLMKGQVHPSDWEELSEWLEAIIDHKVEHQFFATGGNINKVHKLLKGKSMKPIAIKKIDALKEELERLSFEERVHQFRLKPDRADVIIPALSIYLFILEKLACKEVIVPKIGLSDGIIYNLYRTNNNS